MDCERARINCGLVFERRVIQGLDPQEDGVDPVESEAFDHVQRCQEPVCLQGKDILDEYITWQMDYVGLNPDAEFYNRVLDRQSSERIALQAKIENWKEKVLTSPANR